MAKKVGISKQVVKYRIKWLEREGIIKCYLTKLNLSKLGLLSYKVMIQLQNVSLQKEKEIIKRIKSTKNLSVKNSYG
ncbi:winged helix-turn-helix transcriptional regulator [Candidatus Woesearchaeota archaeon]|nr:winged helix-turn-helix transcriptional regulator [Candidatus Woesearchaeota archaeon]